MFSEKWKKELISIPNLLSILRIALIPLFIAIYRRATEAPQYLLAGSILAFSCLTDMADGIIARKSGRITNVGKILDPLADKLTQFSLIIALSSRHTALNPVLVLFVAKELFQFWALVFFAEKGKVLPGALFAGKLCTSVLFISLIFLVLFPKISLKAVRILTAADVFFLIYAFISYFSAYFGRKNCLTDLKQK